MSVDHNKNIVEIKDMSFRYDNETVLDNVNFNIHEGDYIGIVGPNGGGKTTLIKLIAGLLKPTTGQINVKILNPGYVSQNVTNFDVKFPLTVKDVVAQGRLSGRSLFYRFGPKDWQMVDRALKTVDMDGYKNKLIGELSGGQKQRVFIARAIAVDNPKLIILDEPTTGVDILSQKKFYSFLKKLNSSQSLAVVLVSHEVETIAKEVNHIAYINRNLSDYQDPKVLIKDHYD